MTKEPEKTLSITVLRPTFLSGKPLEVGKNLTLPRKDALDLIGANKAKLAESVTSEDKAQLKALEEHLKAGKKAKKDKHASEIAVVPNVDSGRDVKVVTTKKVASSELETKELVAKKATDAKAAADAEAKLGKLTNPELQAKLDDAGVEYDANAVKADLVALCVANGIAA